MRVKQCKLRYEGSEGIIDESEVRGARLGVREVMEHVGRKVFCKLAMTGECQCIVLCIRFKSGTMHGQSQQQAMMQGIANFHACL